MQVRTSSLVSLAAAAVVAALSGCASAPTRYYTLAAPVAPVTAAAPSGSAPLWIELAPLAVPERLARPQLVVHPAGAKAEAQIDVLEEHRWASSFESEMRDALASGIAGRLGALDGTRGGRPTAAPIVRIAVQVRQFEAFEGQRIDASLGWTVRRGEQPRALVCQLSLSEPVGASGIDALAQGAQRLTANAAAAIARSVAAMQSNPDTQCPN